MFVKPCRLSIVPFTDNPYHWDGTHLGEVTAIGKATSGDDTYLSIIINGYRATCLVKTFTTTFPIIVDELKPILGLPKLGTHTANIGNKRYLLIRAVLNKDGTIAEDIPLNKIQDNTAFRRHDGDSFYPTKDKIFLGQVRDIFAFRELLGVTPSYEKCVRVRVPTTDRREDRPFPISYWESTMSPHDLKRITPGRVISKWFSGYSLNHAIAHLLDITSRDDISSKLSWFRGRIEEVIHRVDPQSIWVSLYIIERAMKRMLLHTTESSKSYKVVPLEIKIGSKTANPKDKDDVY